MKTIQRYTGYVALVDVLGFRELVGRDDHLQYMDTVAELIDEPQDSQLLQYVLFSDTVIVNTKTDDEEALWLLLRACSGLFAALLEQQIPLRGAIAFGQFDRSLGTDRGVIVAGRPIVEAYHYELKQDWIGMMLCPSVLRRVPDLATKCSFPPRDGKGSEEYLRDLRWPLVLKQWGGIPFHVHNPMIDPDSQEGFAVVPMSKDVASASQALKSIENAQILLQRMRIVSPDPTSQRKYRNAIFFLNSVLEDWRRW